MPESLVLSYNPKDPIAVAFAHEIMNRGLTKQGVVLAKVRGFGAPELCPARGVYVSMISQIRDYLNKELKLEPPL